MILLITIQVTIEQHVSYKFVTCKHPTAIRRKGKCKYIKWKYRRYLGNLVVENITSSNTEQSPIIFRNVNLSILEISSFQKSEQDKLVKSNRKARIKLQFTVIISQVTDSIPFNIKSTNSYRLT